MPSVIAFDADDTLWHHQPLFEEASLRFRRLMEARGAGPGCEEALYARETGNLRRYGYGVKSYMLSMIEAALDLRGDQAEGRDIREILRIGWDILDHRLELLPGVEESLRRLARRFELMVITKGDLFDQEAKLEQCGLVSRFRWVEVVSEKDEATYRAVLAKYGIEPSRFVMVGNSLKSDVLPVLALGGQAIHIPYALEWAHDRAEAIDPATPGYLRIADMRGLADLPLLAGD